jgi:hypothetical protein
MTDRERPSGKRYFWIDETPRDGRTVIGLGDVSVLELTAEAVEHYDATWLAQICRAVLDDLNARQAKQ